MQREPMIYAAAGTIFGFVLGLMVAGAGGGSPAPAGGRPAGPPRASGSTREARAPAAQASAQPLDANELRALESLAGRDKSNVEVRLQLANLLLNHSRYDEAARWLREVLALKPGDADTLADLGVCLLNGGKLDEALAQLDQALKASPGHKTALFNKGLAFMRGGRKRDAVAVWEDLLKRYPQDPQLEELGLRKEVERLRAEGAS